MSSEISRSTILQTALIISAVVGSLLVLINHADHLLRAEPCARCYAKCGLCYVVPFLVSLVSSALVRRGVARTQRRPERR
jgi:hypothetical protein